MAFGVDTIGFFSICSIRFSRYRISVDYLFIYIKESYTLSRLVLVSFLLHARSALPQINIFLQFEKENREKKKRIGNAWAKVQMTNFIAFREHNNSNQTNENTNVSIL